MEVYAGSDGVAWGFRIQRCGYEAFGEHSLVWVGRCPFLRSWELW